MMVAALALSAAHLACNSPATYPTAASRADTCGKGALVHEAQRPVLPAKLDTFRGARVASVEIVARSTVLRELAFGVLRLREGSVLTREDLEKELRALEELEAIEKVDVDVQPRGDRVVLRYALHERRVVSGISYRWQSPVDLEPRRPLARGELFDVARVERARVDLERQLSADGYTHARVEARERPSDATDVEVCFLVDAGNRAEPTKSAAEAFDPNEKRAIETGIGELTAKLLQPLDADYSDPVLLAYVTAVGRRIASRSEHPDLKWDFHVLDTPAVGAFAYPGGYVTITRGLLAYLGSEAELAAIVAHEIAHVAFGRVHVDWAVTTRDTTTEPIGDSPVQRADAERQADAVGARYLAEAGYEPSAMVAALSALDRGAKHAGSGRPDENAPDPHPPSRVRLARAAVAARGSGDWGRERYRAQLAGLDWGDSRATPFLVGRRYVMPDRMTFTVPDEYSADAENGVLHARESTNSSEEPTVIAYLLPKSFLTDAMQQGVMTKMTYVTRDVAGQRAIVARHTVRSDETKTLEHLSAMIDGPSSVVVVDARGNSQATEAKLDAFLDTATHDTPVGRTRTVLAIERVDVSAPFDDFVRWRCPSMPLGTARALNGALLSEELSPGMTIKCVVTR